MELTPKETERYGRHILLPEIGKEGQCKLKGSRVLIVGSGGLGSPVAIYLAAAGVGTLGLIDSDKVELSNLHRQVIHSTKDLGKLKVLSAKEKINQLNPEVQVITHSTALKAHNALKIMSDYDLIIDGTDNFPSRYLINDACVMLGKPFIFGGILRFEGQCSVFGFPDGPCYRCLFEEPPGPGEVPSCAEAGVLGVLPGTIGLLQANEAIKIICQIGEPLKARLLIFDALATRFREIHIKKNPDCPMCGAKRTIHTLVDEPLACETETETHPQKGKAMFGKRDVIPEITVKELKNIMDKGLSDFYLLDVREQKELDIAHIPGSIFKSFSTFQKNYEDTPKDRTVYVHCKAGGRSLKVIKFLKTKGYTNNLVNVKGGIDAWAKEIDPTMPRY